MTILAETWARRCRALAVGLVLAPLAGLAARADDPAPRGKDAFTRAREITDALHRERSHEPLKPRVRFGAAREERLDRLVHRRSVALLDQAAYEIKLGLGRRGKANFDLFETDINQKFEHL